MSKLGLIAGGGGLPMEVLKACEAADRPVFVVRLKSYADPALVRRPGGVQGSETLPTLLKAEPGVYRVLSTPFTVVQQGIAFAKTDTQLRDAVAGALKKLFADGTYTALITKWELQASAAPAPGMNGGPLP